MRSFATKVLLAILCGACSAGAAHEGPPNVVVVVIDTGRPDLMSVYGHPRPTTPFLERFAERGTRFERAYSTSCWTLPSHGSLFTGVDVGSHGANQINPKLADAVPTLTEGLDAAGYETAAFVANQWINEKAGFARGFDHFEHYGREKYAPWIRALAADDAGSRIEPEEHYVASRVLSWLRDERQGEDPFFLFVNIVEPHLPYLPDAEAAEPFFAGGGARGRLDAIERFFPAARPNILLRHYGREDPLSDEEWSKVTSMYEGALRVSDRIVEAIVEAVDDVADPENTIVFVVSDHGENLGDHDHSTHILNLYDTNLRIVMLARGPGFEPGVVRDPVQILDVPTTVLAAAGAADDSTAGVDLRGEIPGERALGAIVAYPIQTLALFAKRMELDERFDPYKVELVAAVGPRYKLIRKSDAAGRVVGEEIYDLIEDPGETRPLAPGEGDRAEIERLRASLPPPGTYDVEGTADPTEEMDEAEVEALKALGYVGEDESG